MMKRKRVKEKTSLMLVFSIPFASAVCARDRIKKRGGTFATHEKRFSLMKYESWHWTRTRFLFLSYLISFVYENSTLSKKCMGYDLSLIMVMAGCPGSFSFIRLLHY